MVNKQIELALAAESETGYKYQMCWNEIAEPFFNQKSQELHEAFINCPTTDNSQLVTIKMQHNALLSMKDHFQHYINTGKLAQKTLNEENSDE
tara:strand:+ start:2294 stop:2572 length:279 start_codon:yes stop_codon:yes gene_type:complete